MILVLRVFVIFFLIQMFFNFFTGRSVFEPFVLGMLINIVIALMEIKQKLEEMSEL